MASAVAHVANVIANTRCAMPAPAHEVEDERDDDQHAGRACPAGGGSPALVASERTGEDERCDGGRDRDDRALNIVCLVMP